jgi:hypothetical protein
MFNYYVYIYLNPLKKGKYTFGKFSFKYEPFYVGKGKNYRYKVHLIVSDKINKLKQNTLNKIKKVNKEPIVIKLYENVSEYSAFRLERYLIKLIGRRDLKLGPLVNLTNGGEGTSGTIYTLERRTNMLSEKRKLVQYDNEGNVLNIWINVADVAINYPFLSTNHLHRACRSNGRRKLENCFWKYWDGESIGDIVELNDEFKPILQYDLKGNFIKEWNCANEARGHVNSNGSAILKCCRNNAKQLLYYKFKDFMWFFKNGNIVFQIKTYNENKAAGDNKIVHRDINMYNLSDELLGTYSPKELKNMGFFTKTIYRCCDNKFKTTQGFKWKWA